MKKFSVMAAILVFALSFAGCSEVDKQQSIKERIAALQTAINDHSYTGYMSCFDSSDSYWASYTSGDFNSDYPTGVTYTFSNIVVVGSTATADSTKSTTGSTVYTNTFVMTESDDEYYIKTWTEDSSIIFQKK